MSLGVNNIPRKTCTYSCVYCQVGKTDHMTLERRSFYPTGSIFREVLKKISGIDVPVDVITFVPDGEPTLDIELGSHLRTMREIGTDTAVITNSSLLWRKDVREDLNEADIVSVKIDSADERTWKKVDRPHGNLSLKRILRGIGEFSESYKGRLWTETMLVKGVNDDLDSIERTVEFLEDLDAEANHVTVPVRPPAEDWVSIPDRETLEDAYMIFSRSLDNVSMVTGNEKGDFGSSGDLERDLIATCSVHPMREDSVMELVRRTGGSMYEVNKLVRDGKLEIASYRGTRFFRRKVRKRHRD